MITVTTQLHVRREANGRKRYAERPRPSEMVAPGRVPRISRLMALAIKFDKALRDGEVADLSELARICKVTPARITQIMNLTLLAPDIQEAILFLPATASDRGGGLHVLQVQLVALMVDWARQRGEWGRMVED